MNEPKSAGGVRFHRTSGFVHSRFLIDSPAPSQYNVAMHFRLESLETRRLLAGITLITHGFQSDGVQPLWVDRMAEAVDKRVEPAATTAWTDASFYRMRATGSSSVVNITTFSRVAGPTLANSKTGEVVIALDWASVSGLSGPSTTLVAQAVVSALSSAGTTLGFTNNGALALPIHLIGHSRGGSLISEIGRLLGQQGVWVDQVTTLDAFPIGSDPAVNLTDNVVYADNFYETTDFIVHGSAVSGAQNFGPFDFSSGGASLAHSDVHTYYHGSIDRGATGDGDVKLNPNWYGTNLGRATSGFDTSRISGGTRGANGLASLDGGSATRSHVATVDPIPKPNFIIDSITGGANGAFKIGDTFTLNYRYQMHTNSGEIDVYLDTDQNMFNGFTRVFAIGPNIPQTGATPTTTARTATNTWTTGVSPGVYYINGIITDGTAQHQRLASLSQPILVTPDGFQLITKRWADDTASHAFSEPRNWSPGAPPSANDRALVHFGQSNLTTDANVRELAVANDAALTMSATQHISTFAVTDNGRASLASNGTRILSTNALYLESSADLDLNDNDLLVNFGASDPSPLTQIANWINTARADGEWTGHGITSTAARTSPQQNTTLGFMTGDDYANNNGSATFDSEPFDGTSVLVKYTYLGDIDFNGNVDVSDYNLIDFGFVNHLSGWSNGDMDGNGAMDVSDYNLIDFAFATQTGAL